MITLAVSPCPLFYSCLPPFSVSSGFSALAKWVNVRIDDIDLQQNNQGNNSISHMTFVEFIDTSRGIETP